MICHPKNNNQNLVSFRYTLFSIGEENDILPCKYIIGYNAYAMLIGEENDILPCKYIIGYNTYAMFIP